jgi:hypothetical protein
MMSLVRLSFVLVATSIARLAPAQTKWHPGHYMRIDLERVDRTGSDDVLKSIAKEACRPGRDRRS